MVSTKEEPGAFDGLERALPGEPVFTLRAHDTLAADLVHEWVDRKRKAINHSKMSAKKRKIELIQCREAEEIAFAMVDWRTNAEPVAPDVETPKKASTNTMTALELKAKARFDAIKGAASMLHNSVAGICDAVELLAPFGFTRHRSSLLTLSDKVKARAMDIQPKRASYAHLVDESSGKRRADKS